MIRSAIVAFLAAKVTAYLSNGTVIIPGASSYNGLNLVPQMGWDNWNAFGCSVDEELLLTTAQSMIDYGLRDLGYNYVVMDDCWSEGRNSSGFLVENSLKFPNGLKYVADRIHELGMKFGIYSSAGVFTCGKYPGSLGYETQDAQYWAEVGVDYLKYVGHPQAARLLSVFTDHIQDNCYNMGQSGTPLISFNRYNVMSKALNATGRPIVYSLCNWGNDDPYDWAYNIANSGRMSGDIYDSFNRPDAACPCTETIGCPWPGFHCSAMNILNKMAPIMSRTGSGYFNDMDMLEVGNGGMSDNEYVTHFSMWSIMSSPLIMGTDVRTLSPANLAIYSNPAVIALNQDPSAGAAYLLWRNASCADVDENGQCEYSLWVRGLRNGDYAIALLNGANSTLSMNASLHDIFLWQSTGGTTKPAVQLSQTWDVYDLWGNRMNNRQAHNILNGTAPLITASSNSTTRYNATAMPYAEGIAANKTALFGTKVGMIRPYGTWVAPIPRHSVGLYRLRLSSVNSYGKRDEL